MFSSHYAFLFLVKPVPTVVSAGSAQSHVDCSFICCSSSCALHSSGPTSLWPTWRTEVRVLIKGECSRGEKESQPGIPLCSMPAPGPVLIQHIMSKLLLAAAPIETLIKAIRGSSWGGAGGWEDVVNSGYVGTSRGGGRDSLKGEHGWGCYVDIGGGEHSSMLTFSSHATPSPPVVAFFPHFFPCFSQCSCPSPAVAALFGPGLTVGDL